MRNILVPTLLSLLLPILLAAAAMPAMGAAPTLTVASPAPGSIVEDRVLFEGTANDLDGDLRDVFITIEGVRTITGNLDSNTPANWDGTWRSGSVPDGRYDVSIVAEDDTGAASPAVTFEVILDNAKRPSLRDSQLRFDALNDRNWAPWNDMGSVPTTRLSLDLDFSEEMRDIRNAVNFTGGDALWDITRGVSGLVWLNISYLQTNTSYTIAVGTTATDLAGNPLRDAYEIAFTTTTITTPGTPDPGLPFLRDILELLPFELLPFNLPWWVWVGGGVAAIVATVYGVRRLRRRGGSKPRGKRKRRKRGKRKK